MELSILALLLGVGAGALGGLLYWLIPMKDAAGNVIKETLDMIARRIIIGAIVGGVGSPILMTVPLELNTIVIGFVVGIIAAGYMGIDVIKTLLKIG